MSDFKQKIESFSYEGRAFDTGKAKGSDTNKETFFLTSSKIPAIVTKDQLIARLGGIAEHLDLMQQRTETRRG